MKIQLLICFVLITSQLVNAQQPKGSGGNDLFKKGSCERAGVDFSVCTYCEDKELTKNCKDYWCTDNGTCTEAPLKKPNNQLVRTNVDGLKYTALGKDDTTSKLPKGTKFVNGKVTIQNGYKAVYSSDKKMVFLLADNGAGIRGSFRCDCDGRGTGACNTSLINDKIVCGGDACCEMVVTIESDAYLSGHTMQDIERNPEKLKWKKLVLPVKSN
jgi:hypothetical protein